MPGASPFYNVMDFGAAGNGTTDDTAAINAAIAAAAPSSSPTGHTVHLPAGKYRVSSTLTVPPGLTLQGDGWNTPGSQANVFAGSWIYVGEGAAFSPVTISGSGGAVRNLGFNVFNPNHSGDAQGAVPDASSGLRKPRAGSRLVQRGGLKSTHHVVERYNRGEVWMCVFFGQHFDGSAVREELDNVASERNRAVDDFGVNQTRAPRLSDMALQLFHRCFPGLVKRFCVVGKLDVLR